MIRRGWSFEPATCAPPRELSIASADRVGQTTTWVTNEYEHNGLRADGARIVQRLLQMTRGES